MPFSKVMIDPSHLPAMRSAFEKICCALGLRCGADDPLTDLVVMFIVGHAQAGELDPDRLCELTLRDLGSQQLDANPQEIYPTVHLQIEQSVSSLEMAHSPR
jgi:hypothetical protein